MDDKIKEHGITFCVGCAAGIIMGLILGTFP